VVGASKSAAFPPVELRTTFKSARLKSARLKKKQLP
jgi:hypothetical protein